MNDDGSHIDGTPHDLAGGGGSPRSAFGTWVREHQYAAAATAGAVALVLFGGGALAAGAATGRGDDVAAPAVSAPASSSSPSALPTLSQTPTPTPTPTATARPVPATIAQASPLRTCSVAAAAADPRLGSFEGTVVDASTGATLFDRNGQTPARTGSVMKTLTTATALAVLGPDYRFTTKVTGDPASGVIALVGGGDATLSVGGPTVYTGAPTLADLANQVKAKLGETPITTLDLDATFWNIADRWDPSVNRSEQTIGYQPEVVPLMVDGDRANPGLATSPRSTDPVGRAGDAFRTALVRAGVEGSQRATITRAAATSDNVLGEVQSQPVSTLIGQMIPTSDNTLAEMMARVSSKVAGNDGSQASLTKTYQDALANTYQLDASKLVIKDGSGESPENGVPSAFEAQLMVSVLNGVGSLKLLYDALPVSGQSGTLASRFTGANSIARGAVHAKTGWIDTAYTLGGVIDARDGSKLTFGFYAIGKVSAEARVALDTLTTAVYSCGANLSNE